MFETERLFFREININDFNELHKIFCDPEVMKYVSNIKTKEETIDWLNLARKSYQENGFGPWAVVLKSSCKVIGYCGIYIQTDIDGKSEIELLYGFQKDYWNNGFGSEAANAAFSYSQKTYKINRFISLIEHENIGSEKIAKKLGMKVIKDTEKWGRIYKLYAIDN